VAKKNKPVTKLPCMTLPDALKTFALCESGVQGQAHIQPLHWYTASRLVIEGGFAPETITPRPPLTVTKTTSGLILEYDPSVARPGEQTVFGGLKTKDVDVVVALPGIGPVVAISMKGSLNAFRNLTNRMEEAAGDCTNLHLAYPGLVYAFWHIFRANTEGTAPPDAPAFLKLKEGRIASADIAVRRDGSLSSYLARYFFAMERLSGRSDMRDDPSSYEAVGITLVDVAGTCSGEPLSTHPPQGNPLRHENMFATIYRQYDLRFVYQSPALKDQTRRLIWSDQSPAIKDRSSLDYIPRTGPSDSDESDELEQNAH
jgi:hypothetical protein